MTILQQQNALNLAGQGCNPGGAPNGAQMLGNPTNQTPTGAVVPAPQVGGAGQTINAALAHDAMSRGNVPLNAQPSNLVNAGNGNDSLLAMIARGQVSLNQSNYGQPVSVNARDSGPQNNVTLTAVEQPQATGPGSTITVAANNPYLGN